MKPRLFSCLGLVALIVEVVIEERRLYCTHEVIDYFNGLSIVLAQKTNQRIIEQDGAFVICGLEDTLNCSHPQALALNKLRYRKNGKALIVLVNNKKAIMKELATCGITKATLFPEIDDVASYIKEKYNK